MRGWLALIRRSKNSQQQIVAYRQPHELFTFFVEIPVLDFDESAAEVLARLRPAHRRLGSMDLKIATIALSRDATLLSRNISDFEQIQALKVEDWTH